MSNNVALFDFVPNFCPKCGTPISISDPKRFTNEHIALVCLDCKLHFQFSDHFYLVKMAGGDLELTLYGKYK